MQQEFVRNEFFLISVNGFFLLSRCSAYFLAQQYLRKRGDLKELLALLSGGVLRIIGAEVS